MVLEYFTLKRGGKGKEAETPKSPVLNDEEEKFLEQITSEEQPPPLPQRPVVILEGSSPTTGKDAQIALMDGADKIALPTSPPVETDEQSKETKAEDKKADDKKGKKEQASEDGKKKKDYWGFVPAISKFRPKNKDKEVAANSLASAAEAVKSGGTEVKLDSTVDENEAKKEEEDLTNILDQLNLAAVNNRVFSFSKESQELMDKFKLVLTDLINGVPTAYGDLEKLLKNSDDQLRNMFNNLPPFLQNLVKSLPTKMSAALAPEVLAAASEKPGADAKAFNAQSSLSGKKKRSKIPSLKKLVSQQGAVTAMLRSIMNFLKLRFPVFMTGTNVLLSLALFLLLFVFWYCHKRGRETRLEKERLAADVSDSDVEASELEESTVLESKPTETSEPPIKIHEDLASSDQTSTRVENLPSVLDLPEPKSVPLPQK